MENKKIKLGVIADDFTGASDAASFLVNNGYRVIMYMKVPETISDDCDCVVTALKVRSVEPDVAVKEVKKVLDSYLKIGIEKIYYKFCSTFDSTPRGNIGVIMDYLMETLNVPYTILCPSLPVNGRTVKDGILYVNGVPLAESPMKNHPLNPMWSSFIPELMKNQSKYDCIILPEDQMNSESLERIKKKNNDLFYIIPDYKDDADGEIIAKLFPDLTLFGGGSGLLEHLLPHIANVKPHMTTTSDANGKAIILCGSCSVMTGKQIRTFEQEHHNTIAIDANDILSGSINVEKVFMNVCNQLPQTTLVYSDAVFKNVKMLSENQNFKQASAAMENFFADLAEKASKSGFQKIIVAGGETSGAVALRLGYESYLLGEVVAPGVPVMMPVNDLKTKIILKSGNFGDELFFQKALGI